MVVPGAKNRLDTVTGKKMVAVLIFDALDSFASTVTRKLVIDDVQ